VLEDLRVPSCEKRAQARRRAHFVYEGRKSSRHGLEGAYFEIWSELLFDGWRTVAAKGVQGYIKHASTSSGVQVYLSRHKEFKGRILQGGRQGQRNPLFSLRGANTLYQVPCSILTL
jgi:hypothetical protein